MCLGFEHHRLQSPLIMMVRENVGGRLRTNNVMGGMFLPCCGQACFRIYIYINVFAKVVSDKSQCEISYSMLFIIHKYWIDQYFFEENTVLATTVTSFVKFTDCDILPWGKCVITLFHVNFSMDNFKCPIISFCNLTKYLMSCWYTNHLFHMKWIQLEYTWQFIVYLG